MLAAPSNEAPASGAAAEYRVIVQNTFIDIVDASSEGFGKRSLLRAIRSEPFLCGQAGSLFAAMDDGSDDEDGSTCNSSGCPQHADSEDSEDSCSSAAVADSGAELSSVDEEQHADKEACGNGDGSDQDLPALASESKPTVQGWPAAPNGGASSIAEENERLSRQNLALLETVRQMQAMFQHSAYGTMWSPLDAACSNQAWMAGLQCTEAHPKCPDTETRSASMGSSGDMSTSVMLRNLPNNYTRAMFLELLEREGFGEAYNFLYLPIDFKTQASLGYAFLDLSGPSVVQRFWSIFDGFSKWSVPSRKACNVSWCESQGLQAHIDRYRNSPVMHPSVPDEYKPLLLQGGQRAPFPAPTKAIRAPRGRDCRRNGP